jgi:hypothetical protein
VLYLRWLLLLLRLRLLLLAQLGWGRLWWRHKCAHKSVSVSQANNLLSTMASNTKTHK